MSRHVVFGTGQIGRPLIDQLARQGHDVVAVNRRGGAIPGATVVAGDATNATFTTKVCAGADAVYFCLNAGNYARWAEEFPPLQQGVLAGASRAQARLVVLDNVYAYGPPRGRQLVESMAAHPTSAKSATRAAMTDRLLTAGRTTLRVLGLVKPEMREYLHTLYQFTAPWVVDDSAFRADFGAQATLAEEALSATLAWYRDRALVSTH